MLYIPFYALLSLYPTQFDKLLFSFSSRYFKVSLETSSMKKITQVFQKTLFNLQIFWGLFQLPFCYWLLIWFHDGLWAYFVWFHSFKFLTVCFMAQCGTRAWWMRCVRFNRTCFLLLSGDLSCKCQWDHLVDPTALFNPILTYPTEGLTDRSVRSLAEGCWHLPM